MVDICAEWQRDEGSLAWSLTFSEELSEQCIVMPQVPGEMGSHVTQPTGLGWALEWLLFTLCPGRTGAHIFYRSLPVALRHGRTPTAAHSRVSLTAAGMSEISQQL